jgi:glycosyltransferase involved in cell wall biosynthesis
MQSWLKKIFGLYNSMTFFSIIIPTYNSASTLRRCLDSIIAQDFINFEILIMDGLSTDNTLKVAQDYHDPRIKIYSEQDKGIYDAMNKGISVANGKWLYFMGSDDILYDNNVLSVISKCISPKNKIVYGNVFIDGNTTWASDGQLYDGYFPLSKILKKNISHQALFYHSSVFKENGGYNINYKICADWDFCLKCYSKYDFTYLNTVIAGFKAGGISSKPGYNVDTLFIKEKWLNIVAYFGLRTISKEFRKHHIEIYNSISLISTHFLIKLFYLFYKIFNRIRKRNDRK